MKPSPTEDTPQDDRLRSSLENLVLRRYPLVLLPERIDRDVWNERLGAYYENGPVG